MKTTEITQAVGADETARHNVYCPPYLWAAIESHSKTLDMSVSETMQRLFVAELTGKKSIAQRHGRKLPKARK